MNFYISIWQLNNEFIAMYCLRMTIDDYGMQDDMFAFYASLWYENIIQHCCICIQLDEIRYSYPECNAKVKHRKMAPKFGLFPQQQMAENILYTRVRALIFGE